MPIASTCAERIADLRQWNHRTALDEGFPVVLWSNSDVGSWLGWLPCFHSIIFYPSTIARGGWHETPRQRGRTAANQSQHNKSTMTRRPHMRLRPSSVMGGWDALRFEHRVGGLVFRNAGPSGAMQCEDTQKSAVANPPTSFSYSHRIVRARAYYAHTYLANTW